MPDVTLHPPFEAYLGKKPYIFVSYAHKDGEAVFAEIRRLHDKGYRIWYDEGIDPGNEWPEEIAKSLEGADLFLVFITSAAIQSSNVRNEIYFALNRGKRFLAVHLEEARLPSGLELRMGDLQAILKWRMTADNYERKLTKALGNGLRESGFWLPLWTEILQDSRSKPVEFILSPLGREIVCLGSLSRSARVTALRESGEKLWTVCLDERQHVDALAWTRDYLYLTGTVDVEPNLHFVSKIWLREGDESRGAWYEHGELSRQKYDLVPELDEVSWYNISELSWVHMESTSDVDATLADCEVYFRDKETGQVSIWSPPSGDSITALYVRNSRRVVAALSNGHVTLLNRVISTGGAKS